MILLDTTVLVYALGRDHPLAAPARSLVRAIGDGGMAATTTVEVIQELVHVRARRTARAEAARAGRRFSELLAPLVTVGEPNLAAGLSLFETVPRLGAFDAVLAATALELGVDALVSADWAFTDVPGLDFVDLREAAALG